MLVVAAGTLAYWLAYFFAGAVQTADDAVYTGFENAFPLADGYMTVAYVAAALLLLRGRPLAVPVGIAAGSAMVFLGAMDTLFNLEHGKYAEHDTRDGGRDYDQRRLFRVRVDHDGATVAHPRPARGVTCRGVAVHGIGCEDR